MNRRMGQSERQLGPGLWLMDRNLWFLPATFILLDSPLSQFRSLWYFLIVNFKGSSDQGHFIFEIYVGKRRIRHRTILKLNF